MSVSFLTNHSHRDQEYEEKADLVKDLLSITY